MGTASGGFTWASLSNARLDIVSNEAKYGPSESGEDLKRAESDLGSADHYAQVVINEATRVSNNLSAGVIARKDATATRTFYLGDLAKAATTTWRIFKCVGGSFTSLGNAAASPVGGEVLRLECEGDQITLKVGGVTVVGPVTDTAISAGLRCGLRADTDFASASHIIRLDDFQAGDLGVATANRRRRVLLGAAS